MKKIRISYYSITIFLIYCILFSPNLLAISKVDVDKTITDYSISLTSIQKQLYSISRSIFIHNITNTQHSDTPQQLNIFNNELKEIKNTLNETLAVIDSLSNTQNNQIHSLLTVNSYLEIISKEIEYLLYVNNPDNQYELHESIFFTNSLIVQLISYVDNPI